MSDIPLREHLEAIITLRAESGEQARKIASDALSIRLEHHNGLLSQMKEQAADYARRSDVVALEKRLDSLERMRSNVEGVSAGGKPLRDILWLVAGAALAFAATKL